MLLVGCGKLSGTGIKYTSLQAAMMLKKMKIVDFLLDQPALDLTVKSTDGKNTVTVAVEAKVWSTVFSATRLQFACATIGSWCPIGEELPKIS